MVALLEVDGLTKAYGASVVVDDLSFTVVEGEALGLVGPNGAGKTTTIDLITGVRRATRGSVRLAGVDLFEVPARERTRLGLARTFQIPRPFGQMTVYENVLLAATFGTVHDDVQRRSVEAIARTGLVDVADRRAGGLPLLWRKRLELARALATAPQLLLLDEIAGGLTEAEVLELIDTVKELHADGMTILWVEHIVHALLRVVSRIVAMDAGRKLIEGPAEAVMGSRAVRSVYFGLDDEESLHTEVHRDPSGPAGGA